MSKIKASSVNIVACLLSVVIVFSCLGFKLNAAVALRDTSVDLYFIDDSLVSVTGNIPSNLRTSYTINASGSSAGYEYQILSGYSNPGIQVSSSGVITPAKTRTSYYYISTGQTVVKEEYKEVEVTVRVISKSDRSYRDITVKTHNYASVYVSNRIQAIANSIKTQYATDAERVRAITSYVATNYDYSASYSSASSMILYGGGDCWASTDMIIRLAKACGYQAWSRNGNKDSGAGSGHMNALVQTPDGKIYECEAGFSGSKPRYFTCKERSTLFSYYVYYQDGVKKVAIYQYDGQTAPAVLEIPSTIDGYPVARIDDSFIHSDNLTTVILPDTLETIGNYAFTACGITSLNIPASVSSIGNGILADCDSLTSLTVSPSNPYYTSVGNVIYNKNYTTLVTAPNASSITIPGTVTKIQDYAFYYNDNITSINVPSSVTTIGEGAFGNCTNLTSVTFNGGLTTLGPYVFHSSRKITKLALPSTLTNISELSFYGMGEVNIVLPGNTAPTVAVGTNNGVVRVSSPTNFYIPTNAAGYNTNNWTGSNVTLVRSGNPYADVFPTPTNSPTPTNTSTPTPTPRPAEHIDGGVTAFVERLYTVAMDRTCDIGGRDYWVNSIIANGKTGADVARNFFFSAEFNNRAASMTNEEFLRIVYRTFFDREADAGGLNYYLGRMSNGMTKGDVINAFINSQEWADLCLRFGIKSGSNKSPNVYIIPGEDVIAFVTRYYNSFLNRGPDQGGLDSWSYQLANLKITGTELAYRFLNSQEFTSAGYDNEQFLTRLYNGFMGRAPDAGGLNYYLGRLSNGESRSRIINDFAASPEFRNICIRYGILR